MLGSGYGNGRCGSEGGLARTSIQMAARCRTGGRVRPRVRRELGPYSASSLTASTPISPLPTRRSTVTERRDLFALLRVFVFDLGAERPSCPRSPSPHGLHRTEAAHGGDSTPNRSRAAS